jgi:NitT/TauT family transport system substrate-binding protein
VFTTGQLFPGAVGAALVMSPQLGREQPDGVRRFMRAWLRGERDYWNTMIRGQGDRAALIQTLVDHTTIKDPDLYDQIGLAGVDPNASTDPTPSWAVFQEFYVRRGLLERPVDIEPYVDFSYVNDALDVLGRV